MRQTNAIFAVIVVFTLMLGTGGCEKRKDRAKAQPLPHPIDKEHPLTRQFDRCAQNAQISDMAISDVHFMPNRSRLNGTGTVKLNRLAWIVDQYGGTIRIDLEQVDAPLSRERVATVTAYLLAWGVPEGQIKVVIGLPPTKGMAADEAILIYEETRFKPEEEDKKGLF